MCLLSPRAISIVPAILISCLFLGARVSAQMEGTKKEELRDWVPADSVAVRYYQDIVVSPDGSMFFFISFHGNLAGDSNVYELTVFSTADISAVLAKADPSLATPLLPLRKLVRENAVHKGYEFERARWESDSKVIFFEGIDQGGKRQLYHYDVLSDRLTALTSWRLGVGEMAKLYGKTVIGILKVPTDEPKARFDYPAYITKTEHVEAALSFHDLPGKNSSFASYRDGEPWELKSGLPGQVAFSPINEGRRLIASSYLGGTVGAYLDGAHLPETWKSYDRLQHELKNGPLPRRDLTRFVLIEADRRIDKPLFSAPTGIATQIGFEAHKLPPRALWAHDGRHVVLVNTALPPVPGNLERTRMAYIVGYDTETAEWEIIEPLQSQVDEAGKTRRVVQVGWLKEGIELLVVHESDGKPSDGTLYHMENGKWIGQSVAASLQLSPIAHAVVPQLSHGITVALRQDANTPPVFFASNGRNQVPLSESDPALKGIKISRQEPFEWSIPGGEKRVGGLLLPPEAKNKPVPLVIQAYSYTPDKFKPDGPEICAYAAQALVARGMAVLNVTIPASDPAKINTPRELMSYVAEVDSAANSLADRGLVDRARVGLVGFSRGGYESYYAITHPGKVAPAAAVIDDGFPGTYYYSLLRTIIEVQGSGFAYGRNFWQDKELWLEHEPSFNQDRVRTPTLLTSHSVEAFQARWDIIGAFMQNRRPFEHLVFPNGSHVLEMPRERFASLEATVDWMCFWLKGETPKDPERAARWAILRKQQDEVLKTPQPPRGKWQFVPDADQGACTPPGDSKSAPVSAFQGRRNQNLPQPVRSQPTRSGLNYLINGNDLRQLGSSTVGRLGRG